MAEQIAWQHMNGKVVNSEINIHHILWMSVSSNQNCLQSLRGRASQPDWASDAANDRPEVKLSGH